MAHRDWTRDELILAMNLYCQLPFGRLHSRTPAVIRLAEAIGRTPSSVAMKLCNLASLDLAHQERGVKGLSSTSKADREIWAEFHSNWNELAAQSEQLRLSHQLPADENEAADAPPNEFTGETEAVRPVAVRLTQRFFRRAVLASFNSICCVSGIAHKDLLVASHIVPWSKSPEHRANPQNGLCLSRIHDAAFDKGLITFDEESRLVLSKELAAQCDNNVLHMCFRAFEGKPMTLPNRFRPDSHLLEIHRQIEFRW